MGISTRFGPKDLLYKSVVDSSGNRVGTVVNITQNGTGRFDLFGVEIEDKAKGSINNGRNKPVSQLFLDVDSIETVDETVRLKKRLEEL